MSGSALCRPLLHQAQDTLLQGQQQGHCQTSSQFTKGGRKPRARQGLGPVTGRAFLWIPRLPWWTAQAGRAREAPGPQLRRQAEHIPCAASILGPLPTWGRHRPWADEGPPHLCSGVLT